MSQQAVEETRLSHSQIQEFTWCSMKHWLHKIRGVEPEFVPSSLVFGVSIHEALATYHKGLADGRQTALEELCDVFDRRWGEEPVHYSAGKSESGLKAIARSLLQTYVSEAPLTGEIVRVEEFFRLVLDDDLPPIRGYIDLIERTPDDQLVITDLKTSSRDEPPGPAQLVLYSQALEAVGLDTESPVRLQYIVLPKRMDSHLSTFPVQVNQEDVDRLTSDYREVYQAIQDGVFHPRSDRWCGECPWKNRCPGYEFDLDPLF